DPEELEELGFVEAVSEGVALVEWPDRAADQLAGAIHVKLSEVGDGRRVEITAPEGALNRIAHTLEVRKFLDRSGYEGARRRFMLGDASIRAYETILARAG